MIELSVERVDQILHNETPKTEVLPTILRGVYLRYRHVYEKYFADIDALNDDVIADLKKYHEETQSLVKYYFLDIPKDICNELEEFDTQYNAKLLGTDWHETLFEAYAEFCADNDDEDKSAKCLKAEFSAKCLEAFYEAMEHMLRSGFGTASKMGEDIVNGLAGLLFGGDKK